MADDTSFEYIKAIISVADEDKKSVLLYVAFDLAVISLTLSEKIFQATGPKSAYVAAGLCLLLASAGLFFNHYRKIHLSIFRIVDELLTKNTSRAREIPTETWEKHKLGYIVGYCARLLGIALLVAAYLAK